MNESDGMWSLGFNWDVLIYKIDKITIRKEYKKLTNRELVNSSRLIEQILDTLPIKVVEIHGKRLWFYTGIGECGLCGNVIDKRKFHKLVQKYYKNRRKHVRKK